MMEAKTNFTIMFLIALVSMGGGLGATHRPTSIKERKVQKENIISNLPNDIKIIVEGLYSSDPIQRSDAADQLEKMGPLAVPAIPFLIEMFGDSDWVPAQKAALALGSIGKAAVQPLTIVLNDRDPRFRYFAAKALSLIAMHGDRDLRALLPLIETLNDVDKNVRLMAVEALGMMLDIRAIAPLIASLNDEDIYVRASAAWALGEIAKTVWRTSDNRDSHLVTRTIESLMVALKNENQALRENAASSLSSIGPALPHLISALENGNSDVVIALEKITHPWAVDVFTDILLTEKNNHVREISVVILENIVRSINLPESKTREYVNHAICGLINVLEDKNVIVRHRALKALENITGKHLGEDSTQWMEWWRNNQERILNIGFDFHFHKTQDQK